MISHLPTQPYRAASPDRRRWAFLASVSVSGAVASTSFAILFWPTWRAAACVLFVGAFLALATYCSRQGGVR